MKRSVTRANLVDDPGQRKIHDIPIPLAGGFAVLTGILLPLAAGAVLLKLGILKISSASLIVHGINRRAIELGVIAFGAIAVTVLGWLDDKHELKPLPKFAGQFLIALLVRRLHVRVRAHHRAHLPVQKSRERNLFRGRLRMKIHENDFGLFAQPFHFLKHEEKWIFQRRHERPALRVQHGNF